MSEPTDQERAERYLKEGKVIRATVDALVEELEKEEATFLATTPRTTPIVTSYIDSWQHMRGKIFHHHWKVTRGLEDARDDYNDGMRRHMTRGLSSKDSLRHYDERAEVYKTANLSTYQVLRVLEKIDIELKMASRHFESKIRWLEDMRRQMRREDDDFRYAAKADYIGS